jgi:hypothetical protein
MSGSCSGHAVVDIRQPGKLLCRRRRGSRRRAANFFIKCRGYEEIISGRESDQIVDLPRSISFTKSEHRTSIRLQAPGAT